MTSETGLTAEGLNAYRREVDRIRAERDELKRIATQPWGIRCARCCRGHLDSPLELTEGRREHLTHTHRIPPRQGGSDGHPRTPPRAERTD